MYTSREAPCALPGRRNPGFRDPETNSPCLALGQTGTALVPCGGEIEIRTLERLPPLHDFQSCSFDQLGHLSVFVEPVSYKRRRCGWQAFFCRNPQFFPAGTAWRQQARFFTAQAFLAMNRLWKVPSAPREEACLLLNQLYPLSSIPCREIPLSTRAYGYTPSTSPCCSSRASC